MKDELEHTVTKCPRFVHKSAPLALGRTLTLIGGAMAVLMFVSLKTEKHLPTYIITVIIGVVCSLVCLLGIATMLTGVETIRISREDVRLCLGAITLRRVPFTRLRSVVASVREIRLGMFKGDRDLYLLSINPRKGFPIWMERINPAAEAFKQLLPDQADLI